MNTGAKRYGEESPAIRQSVAWLASALPLATKRLGWEVNTEPLNGGLYVTITPPSGCKYDYRVAFSAEGEGHYARVRMRGADGTQGQPMYPSNGAETLDRIIKDVAHWEVAAVTGGS